MLAIFKSKINGARDVAPLLKARIGKFHKSFKASPCSCYMKIKYEARGLGGNIALGYTSCYITIAAACLILYFTLTYP